MNKFSKQKLNKRTHTHTDRRRQFGTVVSVSVEVADAGQCVAEARLVGRRHGAAGGGGRDALSLSGRRHTLLRSSHAPPPHSLAEWLACWTQAQKARVQFAVATLSANSLRQTVHTHRASVHQAAKLVAARLRVAKVTAGLVESNGSLPSGL